MDRSEKIIFHSRAGVLFSEVTVAIVNIKNRMNNHQLDKTDISILELLQNDGRLTHKELAHRLHKSVTPIHVRVKRLQDEGYIKNYVAILDHAKIGKGLIGYIQVTLKEHSFEALTSFRREVVKLREVMECYHMNGAFDFLLRIVIRDVAEYNDILMEKLSKLPDVGNMQSFFVMSEMKHETAYSVQGMMVDQKS